MARTSKQSLLLEDEAALKHQRRHRLTKDGAQHPAPSGISSAGTRAHGRHVQAVRGCHARYIGKAPGRERHAGPRGRQLFDCRTCARIAAEPPSLSRGCRARFAQLFSARKMLEGAVAEIAAGMRPRPCRVVSAKSTSR